MNSNFRPGIVDLAHAFGFQLTQNGTGEYVIPGKFDVPSGADENDMSKWVYAGPLLGETCEAELSVEQRRAKDGSLVDGKFQNSIKLFYCRVAGCTEKHSVDLIGKR